MKRVRFNFSRNFIIWILFTYLLPRNGLRIPHPWIIDPFSFVSVSLVLVLSVSRLDSIERYAPASVRSEWMDERRGKKEEKNSRARYIRFLSTRQRAAYVLHEACRFFCALHHEHSPLPLAIPSRFSNHRIIYPSCNERSIRTNTGFLLTESSAQLSKS